MKFKLLIVLIFMLVLSACFPAVDPNGKKEVLLQGRTMGTTYNIKVVVGSDVDTVTLHKAIDEALVQVNQEMSTYIADSELSLFNKSDGVEPIVMSKGLSKVINEAVRLGKITNGMLDVTVGPLVNLWGFGPDFRPNKVPTDNEQQQARARIGLNKIEVSGDNISKSQHDIYVDLSTIAKGYGVDVVADIVEANGIDGYLVEIGGELRLKGFKANGTLWTIAVEKPISNERSAQQFIVPKDNAVATSGDYRNYIEVNGKRYSHIIDPKTGLPIEHRLVSVTIIHPSSMTADGLSTAIMVMGPEVGLKFAEEHELAAMLIVKTEHGFEEINTVKFMQYLK
ncbi:FAD:protein FMN transferase [Thalassotalea atypica]|uniref:FAD:protein FMN transferase n=1 Tax=Thalassotalea atypica TaxID=2054316 RepID=UPI0025739265|nr:FAD:protein FMN transferase [Thalassotalea atypica]